MGSVGSAFCSTSLSTHGGQTSEFHNDPGHVFLLALGREVLGARRELSATVSELKSIREELGISLTDLAHLTRMTVGNLSRIENMNRSHPTIETLRRSAQGLGRRIEIAVVAEE